MKLPPATWCPLVKGQCKMGQCMWFIHIRGTNPQSGQEIDEPDCAVKWLPVLMIDTTRAVRGTQAATESMRNEIVERMDNPTPRATGQLDLVDHINLQAPKLIGPTQ
jgi:hypothetical protein